MPANRMNYTEFHDGVRVRVMCPVCDASGAHYLKSYQPKCHVCPGTVMMQPASNHQVECTWEEAQAHIIQRFGDLNGRKFRE